MKKVLAIVGLLSVFVMSCGKNEPIRPVGYNGLNNGGITQAPAPYPGGYPAPSGFSPVPYPYQNNPYGSQYRGPYPGGSNPYGYNSPFYPQLPPGYPSQFSPFLPTYQWMQQTPAGQNYWNNQIWGPWQQYAPTQGCGIYQFDCFWSYCRNTFGYQMNEPWFWYMDSQFYPWMATSSIAPNVGPQFWGAYIGAPFSPLNSYYGW